MDTDQRFSTHKSADTSISARIKEFTEHDFEDVDLAEAANILKELVIVELFNDIQDLGGIDDGVSMRDLVGLRRFGIDIIEELGKWDEDGPGSKSIEFPEFRQMVLMGIETVEPYVSLDELLQIPRWSNIDNLASRCSGFGLANMRRSLEARTFDLQQLKELKEIFMRHYEGQPITGDLEFEFGEAFLFLVLRIQAEKLSRGGYITE